LFGLTSVTVRDYTIASFLGMLPATVMEVYFGTAIQSVADIITGNLHNSVLSRVFFWAGLAASIIATVALTIRLKRMLRIELEKYHTVAQAEDDLDGELEDDDDALFGVTPSSLRSSPVPRDTALEMADADHALSSDSEAPPAQVARVSSADGRRSSDARRVHVDTASPTSFSSGVSSSTGNSSTRRTSSSALHAALGGSNAASSPLSVGSIVSASSASKQQSSVPSPHKSHSPSLDVTVHPHSPALRAAQAAIDEDEELHHEGQALIAEKQV
jgi:hypothetical protein